jgi:hypothetical protein
MRRHPRRANRPGIRFEDAPDSDVVGENVASVENQLAGWADRGRALRECIGVQSFSCILSLRLLLSEDSGSAP